MAGAPIEYLEEVKKDNPIGTRFLIEVEVKNEDGYNEMMSTMLLPNKLKEFEDKHGCTINKVYHKNYYVAQSETLTDVLKRALNLAEKNGL